MIGCLISSRENVFLRIMPEYHINLQYTSVPRLFTAIISTSYGSGDETTVQLLYVPLNGTMPITIYANRSNRTPALGLCVVSRA